jgi:hypothetical protein
VKRESAGLLRAAADNNVKPTTDEVPSPAADGFGAEHAVTLAAAIPTVRFFCFFWSFHRRALYFFLSFLSRASVVYDNYLFIG